MMVSRAYGLVPVTACQHDGMPAGMDAEEVFDAMVDAVVAGDAGGRVTFWSRGAERMFGWTADDVVGRACPLEFPPPVQRFAIGEHDDALARVRAGENVSLVTKFRRADGGLLDVWAVLSPVREHSSAAGTAKATGWVAVIRDATRQRAIQQELASRVELVSRLASVVAGVNSDLDLPTVLRRISESGRELLSASAAGYVVIEGEDLVVTAVSGLPAKLCGERIPIDESAVGHLTSVGRTSISVSHPAFPNRSRLITEHTRHLPLLAVALTRVDNALSGALYVFFDSDERALGRAELGVLELLADAAGTAIGNARAYERERELREHERSVIDATADGMAVVDGSGRVRHWNPAAAALTGLTESDVIGQPLPFPVAEPGVVMDHRLPSGVWLEILCSRIGELDETVVDFRDITRSKAIEASKDLFLAVTSHELRTPITVVQGYATTLLAHWDEISDDERRESVDRIADRTRALAALVEQLLLGSRAGAAAPRVAVKFDLAGLLRTTIDGLETVSAAHDFSLEIDRALPMAVGDPSSVEIAITQLLENAVKYSPDGGQITVTARHEPGRILVEVADRGVGIPDGEHESVFDRFYQVGGDRRRFGGVGLGLYIVRRLLDSQGGSVRATPRPGGGTCFEITLPTVP
jgi:PAS domain S-box-containing protein